LVDLVQDELEELPERLLVDVSLAIARGTEINFWNVEAGGVWAKLFQEWAQEVQTQTLIAAVVRVRLELIFIENIGIQTDPERVKAAAALQMVQDGCVNKLWVFSGAITLRDDLSDSLMHTGWAGTDQNQVLTVFKGTRQIVGSAEGWVERSRVDLRVALVEKYHASGLLLLLEGVVTAGDLWWVAADDEWERVFLQRLSDSQLELRESPHGPGIFMTVIFMQSIDATAE
jgi:hypothetical protein